MWLPFYPLMEVSMWQGMDVKVTAAAGTPTEGILTQSDMSIVYSLPSSSSDVVFTAATSLPPIYINEIYTSVTHTVLVTLALHVMPLQMSRKLKPGSTKTLLIMKVA
jgi:hypothetical protein